MPTIPLNQLNLQGAEINSVIPRPPKNTDPPTDIAKAYRQERQELLNSGFLSNREWRR